MGLLFRLARFGLFRLDPEDAHDLVLGAAERAGRRRWLRKLLAWLYTPDEPHLRTHCMGMDFPTPIGLAAGFDRDARAIPALAALGFGHVEVGSVLPEAWSGSPRPRLFRPRVGESLAHVRGLPSEGAATVARSLGSTYPGIPVGVNLGHRGLLLGESTTTLIDDVADAARMLGPMASYLTLQTRIPGSTPGQWLEDPAQLKALLEAIVERVELPRPPLLVKLSPDLDSDSLDSLAGAALEGGAQGLVLGGGSGAAPHVPETLRAHLGAGRGEVSGPGLLEGTLGRVRRLRHRYGPRLVLVACGGITTGADAFRAVQAGADLVQLLTALVYRGPAAPGMIARELVREMRRTGARSLTSVRGRGDAL